MARYDKLVTRFPNGFTNIGPNKPLSQMPQPDPTKCHVLFDDFNDYVAGDWTVTETNAAATEALTPGNGGQLLITNTNVVNDIVTISPTKKDFTADVGKRVWMECRVKLSNVANGAFQMAMQSSNTTVSASDAFGVFSSYDANNQNKVVLYATSSASTVVGLDIVTDPTGFLKNDPEFSAILSTCPIVENNTFAVWSVYYDGQGGLYLYKDGSLVQTLNINPIDVFPTGIAMYPVFATYCTNAAANTATYDYVFFAQER